MAKILPPVLLNAVQLSTVRELNNLANERGVLNGEMVRSTFKMNVVGALLARGVIKTYHNGYRMTGVEVQLKPFSTPRTPKNAAATWAAVDKLLAA